MTDSPVDIAPTGAAWRHWLMRLAVAAACVAAAAATLSLAYRPISSPDIGYHLLYGEHFLTTGDVVDDARFVAPPPRPTDADELPPGGWVDAQGELRFPNANWLSQVIMAAAHRVGGVRALTALTVALVAIILAAQAAAVRRLGLGWAWVAPVWLLSAMAANERFLLRPELFGYACLAVQLALLAGPIRRWHLLAYLAVQLLMVNVHGYWLLGVAMLGAVALASAGRAAWQRWIAGRAVDAAMRAHLASLAVALAIAMSLSLAHPHTWRNALHPVQTLLFLRQHDIAGTTPAEVSSQSLRELHPWAIIGEFHAPFVPRLMDAWATWAFIGLLGLSAVAAVGLAARRRWALIMLQAGMVLVGLSMRRNIAPAAVILAPLAAAGVGELLGRLARSGRQRRWVRPAGPAAVGAVLLFSIGWTGWIASGEFYIAHRRPYRFGHGLSRLHVPLGPAAWLDENLPAAQAVFADHNLSSNIVYFSQQVSAASGLTNTWAYPIERMREIVRITFGDMPADPTLEQWGMDVLILHVWPDRARAVRQLLADPDWAMVYAETWFAVFARRTEANAQLIARHELSRPGFDIEGFIATCAIADTEPATGLKAGAGMLQVIGWHGQAERVWRACLDRRPDWAEAWLNRGVCLIELGRDRLDAGDPGGIEQYRQAARCFERALSLDADYAAATVNLHRVRQDIRRIEAITRGLGR